MTHACVSCCSAKEKGKGDRVRSKQAFSKTLSLQVVSPSLHQVRGIFLGLADSAGQDEITLSGGSEPGGPVLVLSVLVLVERKVERFRALTLSTSVSCTASAVHGCARMKHPAPIVEPCCGLVMYRHVGGRQLAVIARAKADANAS